MKPGPLTELLVGTLTEARPFVVSSVSLVVQLGGVWRRLWRKQKAKLQAKHSCVSARGLRMELTLTCSVTCQRREGGGLESGLHLTVGAAPLCCWDGRRSRFRSVVGNPPQISHLKTGIGTLCLQWTGLVLVDGFPPSSLLLCLLYRDVRPAAVVVIIVHWRFVPPAGGSWGDGQEINTTYTIAPKNSWSCSYQLRLQCCSFLWLLILKLGKEFQNTLSREKEVTVWSFWCTFQEIKPVLWIIPLIPLFFLAVTVTTGVSTWAFGDSGPPGLHEFSEPLSFLRCCFFFSRLLTLVSQVPACGKKKTIVM